MVVRGSFDTRRVAASDLYSTPMSDIITFDSRTVAVRDGTVWRLALPMATQKVDTPTRQPPNVEHITGWEA